jgi:DNA processing protein
MIALTSAERTLLHLNLINGIGAVTIAQLIEQWSHGLGELYQVSVSRLANVVAPALANKIVKGLQDMQFLNQELSLLEHYAINVTTLLSDNYPLLLRAIYGAPPVLYYQGRLPFTDNLLALVGSRKADYYGRGVVKRLIKPLVSDGWLTVSGGALGIDKHVHQETVLAGGTTVVVLGSGLLRWYPVSNKQLFTAIIEQQGCIMSPFALTTEPLPGNFPARNRIIAGLSKGCVVVQAAAKSGALITAKYALEQGREVFAVPGSIDNPLSTGCHALLRQGATLVTEVQDIVEAFGGSLPSGDEEVIPPLISSEQSDILSYCGTARSFDELSAFTGLDDNQLHQKLFDLQCEGKLLHNMAGLFECL